MNEFQAEPEPSRVFRETKKAEPSRADIFRKKAEPSRHVRCFISKKTKNNETADISDIFFDTLLFNESINASFGPKNMENNVNGFSYRKNGVSYRETMLTVSLMENGLSSFPIFHFRKNKKSRAEPTFSEKTKKAEPNRADIFETQKKSSRAEPAFSKKKPSRVLR